MSKRITPYPLRMPQDLRDQIEMLAEENDRSVNSEIVGLIKRGLETHESRALLEAPVKIIHLDKNTRRLVHGKYLHLFDLDYTQPLNELFNDVSDCLDMLLDSKFSLQIRAAFTKAVAVYSGSNHIDIINDGVGSLNWLVVEDHWIPNEQEL